MFYLIKAALKKIQVFCGCIVFCLIFGGLTDVPPGADALAAEQVVSHKLSLKKKTRKKDLVETSRLEDHIRHLEKDAHELTRMQADTLRKLDKANHEINQRQLRISLISQEINELVDKIAVLDQRRQTLMEGLETRRSRVNERLVTLYRIKGTGYWHLFSRPGSVFDFWRRQQALTRVIRRDVRLLEEQVAALKALKKTGLLIAGETGEKKLLEAHLVLEIENLEAEQKKRRNLLDGVREKTALTLAAMAAAKKALEQTLEKLEPRLDTSVSTREKAGKTGSFRPGKNDFLSSKGGLAMPVKGAVISKFGSRTGTDDNTFTFQTGIDIRAERGEPVRCVFRGEVLYADWLKGYGNLIIINHGDNYYTLYAHMEELFKKKGDVVEGHEVIATAGDTGSIRGTSLHFEVRHHGKPVDPLKWLKKGV